MKNKKDNPLKKEETDRKTTHPKSMVPVRKDKINGYFNGPLKAKKIMEEIDKNGKNSH
jgi:hypothetical protein